MTEWNLSNIIQNNGHKQKVNQIEHEFPIINHFHWFYNGKGLLPILQCLHHRIHLLAILNKSYVFGISAKALSTTVKTIFPNHAMWIATHPTGARAGSIFLGVRIPDCRVRHLRYKITKFNLATSVIVKIESTQDRSESESKLKWENLVTGGLQ